jgi:hypothetical protein
MRQEAARSRSAAAALDSAAARLRMLAASIRDALAGVVSLSQAAWRGPGAADFEARVSAADMDLRAQAGVLACLADDLAAEAGRLRAEALALDLEAARAEAAIAMAASGSGVA